MEDRLIEIGSEDFSKAIRCVFGPMEVVPVWYCDGDESGGSGRLTRFRWGISRFALSGTTETGVSFLEQVEMTDGSPAAHQRVLDAIADQLMVPAAENECPRLWDPQFPGM